MTIVAKIEPSLIMCGKNTLAFSNLNNPFMRKTNSFNDFEREVLISSISILLSEEEDKDCSFIKLVMTMVIVFKGMEI